MNLNATDICMYIAFGCGLESAARFVGCSPITIRREARRNPEFRDQLRRAQLDCEIGPLNTIRKAAHTNCVRRRLVSGRMNPQQFGKKNVRYVTPEQLAAFAHQVVTAVLDENLDEDARLRAMNKLETFVAQLNQQSPDRDPLSKLKRRRKQKPSRRKFTSTRHGWRRLRRAIKIHRIAARTPQRTNKRI